MNPKDHLEKAIEINPEFSDARFQLALLYIADGEDDHAQPHLEKVIELVPEHAEAFRYLGLVLQRAKQYDESRERFQQSIELDPEKKIESTMGYNVDTGKKISKSKKTIIGYQFDILSFKII